MTWFQQSANETEAAKTRCMAFIAVDFDFPSARVRLWTGSGTLSILGNDFIGIGDLGSVSSPPEHARLVDESKTYEMSLINISPALISESDIDGSFGRSVIEYLGFINVDTMSLVATPEVYWEGRIGTIRRVDGPNPAVQVQAEHRLSIMHTADGYRYTHEHQQEFHVGDYFFREAASIETKEVIWMGGPVAPGRGPGSPYYGGITPLNRER
jgi:hypothetical protein